MTLYNILPPVASILTFCDVIRHCLYFKTWVGIVLRLHSEGIIGFQSGKKSSVAKYFECYNWNRCFIVILTSLQQRCQNPNKRFLPDAFLVSQKTKKKCWEFSPRNWYSALLLCSHWSPTPHTSHCLLRYPFTSHNSACFSNRSQLTCHIVYCLYRCLSIYLL